MSAIVADLGLLPDDDRLKPRVWIGHTVTACSQFRDAARQPVAPVGPVLFTWKGPGNVVLDLPGAAVAGKAGRFECRYQPPQPGAWSVRARSGGDGPILEWAAFEVVLEPPGGAPPDGAIWLTSPDTALVSMQGTHLAGVTIGQLGGLGHPAADDLIPGVRETPDGAVSGHLRWADLQGVAEDAGREAAEAALGVGISRLSVSVPTTLTTAAHGGKWLVLTGTGNQLSLAWADTGDGFACTVTNLSGYYCFPALSGFTEALLRDVSLGVRPNGTATLYCIESGDDRLAFLVGDVV